MNTNLKISNVTKIYTGCVANNNVSLEFNSGKILYQIATPITFLSKKYLNSIAYYQRVILILTILENTKKMKK